MDKKTILAMQEIGIEPDKILSLMLAEEEKEKEPASENGDILAAIEKLTLSIENLGITDEKEAEGKSDPVLDAIEKLTGAITTKNVHNMGSEYQPETADDILAKVFVGKPEE